MEAQLSKSVTRHNSGTISNLKVWETPSAAADSWEVTTKAGLFLCAGPSGLGQSWEGWLCGGKWALGFVSHSVLSSDWERPTEERGLKSSGKSRNPRGLKHSGMERSRQPETTA